MPLFFVNFEIFSTYIHTKLYKVHPSVPVAEAPLHLLIASISSVGKTSLTELRHTRRSDLDLKKYAKREGEGGRGYKKRKTGLEKEGMQFEKIKICNISRLCPSYLGLIRHICFSTVIVIVL